MNDLSLSELPDKLGRLSLDPRKHVRGRWQGQSRSRQSGSSLEFSDYRMYTPGDDFRQLDWNAYGRTGKPFIRTYLDERQLHVHLRIDVSRSMAFGASDTAASKLRLAIQLAACISWIALSSSDNVDAAPFAVSPPQPPTVARGKGGYPRLVRFLSGLEATGTSRKMEEAWSPALLPVQAGMTWIFSDFLYESGWIPMLNALTARGQEVVAVHILSPDEIEPDLTGDRHLRDSEFGDGKDVSITSSVLDDYRRERDRFLAQIRSDCYKRGAGYVCIRSDENPLEVVKKTFKRSGWIK